jgi:hypothetical protein
MLDEWLTLRPVHLFGPVPESKPGRASSTVRQQATNVLLMLPSPPRHGGGD